jgi:uncharacterized protein YyaL (SSP411 family)
MPNHLAHETSPYLKQHQDNPVDWYPWSSTALRRAKQENKPIFLSIGYAACHWCHVMAHESFSNPHTAQLLNEHFINIKVDREERPDLDDIYMKAVVMLTGQGGWPLSVFLTPDLQPFYGGTYFPPMPSHGLPSFNQVLWSVIETWSNQPDAINHNAEIITNAIQREQTYQDNLDQPPDLDDIVNRLFGSYDWETGGWGTAPKFPQPMLIEFLIQRAILGNQQADEMVTHLLMSMAMGGMFDLVGGGFHRYSTDRRWLIPHFEKMLYDNAQLALAYLHGFSLTGEPAFREVATATLTFLQMEMTSPNGGFYASIDADTPEGEGRYYAWTTDELQAVLSSDEFSILQAMTHLSPHGNFTNSLNILQLSASLKGSADERQLTDNKRHSELQSIFLKLLDARSTRIAPHKDQKIITEWNAMAIRAFAEAGLLLDREDYVLTAKRSLDFILKNLIAPTGTIYRSWNEGKANQPGALADYASLIIALQAVYEIDFEPIYYQKMLQIFKNMQDQFSSSESLYYDAAASVEDLIVRPQNLQDNATPSGNALAAYVHWLLANYDHEPEHFDRIIQMMAGPGSQLQDYPTSFGFWLQVAGIIKQDADQIALISQDDLDSLLPFLEIYRKSFRPFSIIAARYGLIDHKTKYPGILHDRIAIKGKPTAYLCRSFTCQAPVTDVNLFAMQLDGLSHITSRHFGQEPNDDL